MKFPPLTEMEPLPPVPSCEEDLEGEEIETRYRYSRNYREGKLEEVIEEEEEIPEFDLPDIPEMEETDSMLEFEPPMIDVGLETSSNPPTPESIKKRAGNRRENDGEIESEIVVEETMEAGPSGLQAEASDQSRFHFLSRAEELAKRIWSAGWMVVHHKHLPKWLKDNDFLIKGHRAPMHSYWRCFKSIFRVHTETGNIWTHLLGFIAFVAVAAYFLSRPSTEIQFQEKAVFSAFFFGAITCLFFSWMFHTVYCHSESVGKFFNKLDYCGISMLTMGSFVPWLYYSFYCHNIARIIYLVLIFILGSTCIIVSMWDKFASAKFRPVRAGVFIALGLSGVVPAMHFVVIYKKEAIYSAGLGWLILMAVLYIVGALIYAARIPERIWPGKFDIWCQSHQIFHLFVIAAAFVHYHGITQAAQHRLSNGECPPDDDYI